MLGIFILIYFMKRFLSTLIVIMTIVWVSLLTNVSFAQESTSKELTINPELIVQYIETATKKDNKEDLYRLILQYKDDAATLAFINELIEENNKENELREKYLTSNLKEQELVESIKNLKKKHLIVDSWIHDDYVSNWFYRSQCTWYAAIRAFPYITNNKQETLWWWNARDWISNAKKAWYSVNLKPKAWDIIVFKWGWYSNLWHVGYVSEVRDLTLTIEDMNYSRKTNEVTKRIILRSDPTIDWFIHMK